MSLTLHLPQEYSWVLVAATSTFFVNTVHVAIDIKHRKASGLKYPIAYATPEQADKDKTAYMFNCAQRAHSNFTENHTSFVGALLIAGLRFPVAAASFGALWTLARTWYAFGYTSSAGPAGREKGAILSFLADTSMKLMAAYGSVMFALGN